ncbi:MAG: hypothetical protein Fur0042_21230 [Cyanophyceae cyanobacterium]
MVGQMIPQERGHKVVAVVIVRLHSQGHGVANRPTGTPKDLRLKLLPQKSIGGALIDQDRRFLLGIAARPGGIVLDQGRGIIGPPSVVLGSEVMAKGPLTPRSLAGIDDRRKGGNAAIAPRIP